MFDVCTTGDTAHIDTIFKFLPHTHTRQHGCIDILHCCNDPCLKISEFTWQWYFARNARCTVTTCLLVWYSNTQNTSPPERPFSHYIHPHRLAAEMWSTMKNNLLGKKCLSCSFYLYRFRKYVSYGFPIINFCNPGVHETPCIHIVCGNVRPISLPCVCGRHEGILFLDLSISWRWVVSITLRSLYLQGENPEAKWIDTGYLLINTWRNAYSPSCKTNKPRMKLNCSLIWIVALRDRQYLRQFLK